MYSADGETELDKTVSQECQTNSHIDDVLRSYLTLIASHQGEPAEVHATEHAGLMTLNRKGLRDRI